MSARGNLFSVISSEYDSFNDGRVKSQPSWLRTHRNAAFTEFINTGFPLARKGNELWKYTNVSPIASKEYKFSISSDTAPSIEDMKPYDLPCPRAYQLVFVDGKYSSLLSTEPASEAQLGTDVISTYNENPIVGRLADGIEYQNPVVKRELGRISSSELKNFVALNTAFINDGCFVYIPEDTHVSEPIYLLYISTGNDEAIFLPRTLIVLGKNSSATILQSFEGLRSHSYFTNSVTEIIAKENSKATFYSFQRENTMSAHISNVLIEQSQGSEVKSVSFDLGGRLVRRDTKSKLVEPESKIKLYGLYHGTEERHIDNHTYVEHLVPNTDSEEIYKGILDHRSTGVFVGDVHVYPDAQRITAHQVNKNILLSPSAKAYTQPKLQIYADDVICTHGAAIGQLDTEAIFYMKSRGISEKAAKQLLINGYTSEIVQTIENDALRQYLELAVVNAVGEKINV
ncbi:MAG: Fe-S cluster assembly protein SufD [Chloroflexi bacterium]|nr:Fe-S cluster assembly protein SufD [Chloroflexota bacterium]